MEKIKSIILFNLPLPPMIESALGYQGTCRYAAFFWDKITSNVICVDSNTTTPGYWCAWTMFTNHRIINPHLNHYFFGSDSEAASHWFVIDRTKRISSVISSTDGLNRFDLNRAALYPRMDNNNQDSLLSMNRWLLQAANQERFVPERKIMGVETCTTNL